MKKIRIQIALIVGILISPSLLYTAPNVKDIVSRPGKVTIYPRQAVITRLATVELIKGNNYFRFVKLPINISRESVRVSIKAGRGVKIFSIELKTNYLKKKEADNKKELRSKLKRLKKRRVALDNKYYNLKANKKLLKSIEVKTVKDLNQKIKLNKLNIESWQSLLDFSYKSSMKIDNDVQKNRETKKKVNEEISFINKQLGNSRKSKRGYHNLRVGVESAKEKRVVIELSYLIRGASWKPKYEVRTKNGKQIDLQYMATIRQNTGEDWNNVAITLSTAKPALGIKVNKVRPLYLTKYKDYYSSKKSKRRNGRGARSKVYDSVLPTSMADEVEEKEEEKVAPVSKVKDEFSSTTFTVRRKASIPADGSSYNIPIVQERLAAKISHISVPINNDIVFITGKVKNTLGYPILSGKSSLYVNNNYLGSSYLKGTAPGEQFSLPLGPDENVKVKRLKLKEFKEVRGFGKKKVRITYQYKIEVENLRRENIEIEVTDRIPVSNDEDIKVSTVSVTPEVTTKDVDRPGVLIWKLKLSRNEKKVLQFTYFIEYPEDIKIKNY